MRVVGGRTTVCAAAEVEPLQAPPEGSFKGAVSSSGSASTACSCTAWLASRMAAAPARYIWLLLLRLRIRSGDRPQLRALLQDGCLQLGACQWEAAHTSRWPGRQRRPLLRRPLLLRVLCWSACPACARPAMGRM